jgi:hypothetical protein
LVGNDPASEVYVRSKDRKALELGMESFQHILPQNTTQEQLLELVAELNANDAVDGILVQLPLPKQIDELAIVTAGPRQGCRRATRRQRWSPRGRPSRHDFLHAARLSHVA